MGLEKAVRSAYEVMIDVRIDLEVAARKPVGIGRIGYSQHHDAVLGLNEQDKG